MNTPQKVALTRRVLGSGMLPRHAIPRTDSCRRLINLRGDHTTTNTVLLESLACTFWSYTQRHYASHAFVLLQ